MVYYFQNPSTGFPMYLTDTDFGAEDPGTSRVELETLDGAKASAEDVADQTKYNRAIAHCQRIHQAALVLFRYHDCKDILT